MSEFATNIGIVAVNFQFGVFFEVLGWASLIGLSIGWLKRHILS